MGRGEGQDIDIHDVAKFNTDTRVLTTSIRLVVGVCI